jgi:hypothetical protein
MPSQLIDNDKIYFLVVKPLKWYDTVYEPGDEFPQEDANNIETLIRSRYLQPVVDDINDKPRHWHREVQLREIVEERIAGTDVQLVLPEIVGGEAVQDVAAEGDGSSSPEVADEAAPGDEVDDETNDGFDPNDHTVQEVLDYIEAHPDEADEIRAIERSGKNRKGIVEGY